MLYREWSLADPGGGSNYVPLPVMQWPIRAHSLYFPLALDRPSGLRALAEMLLVPAGGDVRLGAADWALETAKVTSLSDER